MMKFYIYRINLSKIKYIYRKLYTNVGINIIFNYFLRDEILCYNKINYNKCYTNTYKPIQRKESLLNYLIC